MAQQLAAGYDKMHGLYLYLKDAPTTRFSEACTLEYFSTLDEPFSAIIQQKKLNCRHE